MYKITELKTRLRNAKARAKYWSGSAFGVGYAHNTRRSPAEEYELAMSDCDAIADLMQQITGNRPEIIDYRSESNLIFSAIHSKINK